MYVQADCKRWNNVLHPNQIMPWRTKKKDGMPDKHTNVASCYQHATVGHVMSFLSLAFRFLYTVPGEGAIERRLAIGFA